MRVLILDLRNWLERLDYAASVTEPRVIIKRSTARPAELRKARPPKPRRLPRLLCFCSCQIRFGCLPLVLQLRFHTSMTPCLNMRTCVLLGMSFRADVRLTGNTALVDDLCWALSGRGVSVAPYYASFPQVRHPYLIIEIFRPGVGLGHLALYLLSNDLARRWIMLRWLFITYREASTTPTEWTIQGTPNQVIRQLGLMLWRYVSCPYCGLNVPLGRFCDSCGNKLFQ